MSDLPCVRDVPSRRCFFRCSSSFFCLGVLNCESVRGFRLQAVEVKLLACADDIAAFCTDLKSASKVVQLPNTFCGASGAAVNCEKSCGFYDGAWDATPNASEGLPWSREPFRYLRIPYKIISIRTCTGAMSQQGYAKKRSSGQIVTRRSSLERGFVIRV